MKFSRIQPNPRYAEFQEILAAHREWLKPWAGTFFRFQTIEFPTAKDVLGGGGARERGGRWNQPGMATVYGSTTDTVALEECKANDRYYGVVTKGPRLLVAVEAQLVGVLDLTSPGIRRSLGVTLKELAAEDWRKLLQAGQESSSRRWAGPGPSTAPAACWSGPPPSAGHQCGGLSPRCSAMTG